jgi:hypothetical protein
MAYTTSYSDAARRHMQAANTLHDAEPAHRRRDVAGYLYGIAAECALKNIMRRSHSWSIGRERDQGAPVRLHFPHLKTELRDTASGRHAATLRRFAEDTAFMNEWDITMRYAEKNAVSDALVRKWREDAARVLQAMEDC